MTAKRAKEWAHSRGLRGGEGGWWVIWATESRDLPKDDFDVQAVIYDSPSNSYSLL